jgi:hypothetical protein
MRYRGLDRAHGRYIPQKEKRPGTKKLEGSAGTVRELVTVELWRKHLAGEYGIGIIPIQDNAMCWWGALDIDVYEGFDWEQLERDLERLILPLIPCKTKSGGCHLYMFMAEESPAELVRGRLMEWAVALGHSGIEVFPKQILLASKDDIGNWINMPYFGGNESSRYAVSHGERLTVEQFLDMADACAMTFDELQEFKLPEDEAFKEFLEEAPPCLQCLAKRGIGEGGRNKVMFNLGVYCRNRFGDDYESKMDEYNQRLITPALGHKELLQITKNVGKKSYFYTCKDEPLASVCNRQICLTRKYGIKDANDDPGVMFGEMTKIETDPPKWIWEVNGMRIECETEDLFDQVRFRKLVANKLTVVMNTVKPQTWLSLLREKMQRVQIHQVPEDATQEGQMWILLEQFCTGNAQAKAKEELLMGRPWTEDNKSFFSSNDFIKYCGQQRFFIKERDLWLWIKKRPTTEHHKFLIKGKFGNYWSVPSFTKQDEAFSIPDPTVETV